MQLITLAKIPIVMISHGAGQAFAWNSKGKFILPEEADKVIEANHPFFKEVAQDLVELCHHPDSGELMFFGWRKGFKSLTFHGGEQGSHAGPGPQETSGFALLPVGVLPRSKETVGTQDIRDAAFRSQGRGNENALGDISPIESSGVNLILK